MALGTGVHGGWRDGLAETLWTNMKNLWKDVLQLKGISLFIVQSLCQLSHDIPLNLKAAAKQSAPAQNLLGHGAGRLFHPLNRVLYHVLYPVHSD